MIYEGPFCSILFFFYSALLFRVNSLNSVVLSVAEQDLVRLR